MVIVTDVQRLDRFGKPTVGFYMDGYELENIDGIPDYLKKEWDVVGVFSGHGKVRIGKSTKAFQSAYYVAWRIAGGKMNHYRDPETNKLIITGMTKPTKPVRFDLKENIIFRPEDLVERAVELHKKYGKHQVIVYDEGREGLDSKVMDAIHEIMEDFFQKCGYMGHVIYLVLPNFFKLHEDYAVARSLFLVDCTTNSKKQRGFFNFYNETQKEWLFFLGKKRLGITQKYNAANSSFSGRFSAWLPFDKAEYNKLKEESLKRKSVSKQVKRWKQQRDGAIYILHTESGMTEEAIAEKLTKVIESKVTRDLIHAILGTMAKKREEVIENS